MELNLVSLSFQIVFGMLLIVPYGIETFYLAMTKNRLTFLLIVPYGIETFNYRRQS